VASAREGFNISCWELKYKTALEISQGIESIAKIVKGLTIHPDSPLPSGSSTVHHVKATTEPQTFATGVESQGTMPQHASTKRQCAVNVERLGTCKKSAAVRGLTQLRL